MAAHGPALGLGPVPAAELCRPQERDVGDRGDVRSICRDDPEDVGSDSTNHRPIMLAPEGDDLPRLFTATCVLIVRILFSPSSTKSGVVPTKRYGSPDRRERLANRTISGSSPGER
jgi:hypothetical protein